MRRLEFIDAAIGESDVDLAMSHEADVRMHAVFGADDGLQIFGPVESGRVDHALHADVAGAHDVHLNAADVLCASRLLWARPKGLFYPYVHPPVYIVDLLRDRARLITTGGR